VHLAISHNKFSYAIFLLQSSVLKSRRMASPDLIMTDSLFSYLVFSGSSPGSSWFPVFNIFLLALMGHMLWVFFSEGKFSYRLCLVRHVISSLLPGSTHEILRSTDGLWTSTAFTELMFSLQRSSAPSFLLILLLNFKHLRSHFSIFVHGLHE
jgi:hypothetical protein